MKINRHPLWSTWQNMKQRCTNPNNKDYKYYGARGITVCDQWQAIDGLIASMGDRPTQAHTLERVDNDGHYSPENCVWATRETQARNQRVARNNKSGLSGVCQRHTGKWRAYFLINGKHTDLGTFDALLDAAAARKSAEARYWL